MEKSTDLEKSQRIIAFHWREEAMLKKRLSTLESMKRQVESSFSLDQRILYSRFQTKLRRSALAWARMNGNEELIWRLGDEDFPFNTTLTNHTERTTSQLTGVTYSHRLGSSGQRTPAVPGVQHSKSACRPRRSVLSRNTKCKSPQLEGAIPPERTRSQSSQPSFRRVISTPLQRLSSSALLPRKRPVKLRPVTATVAFQDTKKNPGQPQPTDEESGERAREGVKDDPRTPASKHLKDLSPKHKPSDDPAAQTPRREEAEERRSKEKPSGAVGTRGHDLTIKVSRFVEMVRNMKHQGCIMSDYYTHKLTESLSSREERERAAQTLQVTEDRDDRDRWCLVGSERASRSITMLGLDTAPSAPEPTSDLLILESYSALLTRENREERNWMDNNPYCRTGPSASL